MRLPEIAHGQEHEGIKQLAPDIPEQLELANRIDVFLKAANESGIQPAQKTRIFKDYRSPQPNGMAHVSAAYSDELDGRFSAEIHAAHRPSGIQAHYSLLADGGHWLRTDSNPRGHQDQAFVDHDHMVEDMLEYAPEDGAMSELLDRVASARAIVKALSVDMSRGAHYKTGSDHYRAVVRTFTEDGYASARQIELIDARVNNQVERRLAVTALINIASGPVDISQTLAYDARYNRRGGIRSDGIQLVHSSSDGLTPQALANLAETSDVVARRIDILHDALDVLSRETFVPRD